MKHTRQVVRHHWGEGVLTPPAGVGDSAAARAVGALSANVESSFSSAEASTATAGVAPIATTLVGGKHGEEDGATEVMTVATTTEDEAEQPAMVCLVDPPRAGLLSGALDVLLDMDFDVVVYIACGDGT